LRPKNPSSSAVKDPKLPPVVIKVQGYPGWHKYCPRSTEHGYARGFIRNVPGNHFLPKASQMVVMWARL